MNQTSISTSSVSGAFIVLDIHTGKERSLAPTDLCSELERQGVLVFPRFFSQSELVSVRAEMNAHFAPIQARAAEMISSKREGEKEFACDVVVWDPIKEDNVAFQECLHHSPLAAATEAVLGSGYTEGFSLVMFSVGGGRGQAWHQDCPPDASAGFNLNRLIYPEDVALEDGAIVFVPGSHRQGRIPPGGHQDPIAGEIVLTPKAGTLVLLHGHVYHRVTPNLNRKPRVSVNFRAFPAGISSDVTCIGVYRNGTVNFCDKAKMHDGTPAVSPMAMGM